MSGTVGRDHIEEKAEEQKPALALDDTKNDSTEVSKPVPFPSAPKSAKKSAIALTDRALQFFANASNETLGACLVGLGASTYLVLGRVGLVLIGVVGGIVLHATWEGSAGGDGESGDITQEDRRKREIGIEVANRVLNWRSRLQSEEQVGAILDPALELKLAMGKNLDYSDFRPETAKALEEITDAVIRDYVKWWYSPIIPEEESFPTECRRTLTAFILAISSHLSRKRPADTFLDFMANSSSTLIVFLNELSNVVQASSAPMEEAVDLYLKMKPNCPLSSLLDRSQQERKLTIVAEDIVQSFLESKTYNCRPAHLFLREILAKTILDKTIQTCSSPDWINGWIVYLLEEGEPEIMNAIDAGVEQSAEEKLVNAVAKAEAAESEARSPRQKNFATHRRTVSKAQEAMDEAMREAARLTQMIAEEDAKRIREQQQQEEEEKERQQQEQIRTSNASLSDDNTSENVTQGIHTPSSSQDELGGPDLQDSGIMKPAPQPARRDSDEPPPSTPKAPFTSFDQIIPNQGPTALADSPERKKLEPLTLVHAKVTILDDSMPGDSSTIRNKPTSEYLIQVEPASSQHPGWMNARKYSDFERLHEVLWRISKISGGVGFSEAHAALPTWKGHTKASLRGELERYLNDAVRFTPLAESEGMRRFLEKDTAGLKAGSSGKGGIPGIGWPSQQSFENMGKGMMDALTQAPKEVAGGGKALFGGVKGVLGTAAGGIASLGPKRTNSSSSNLSRTASPSGAGDRDPMSGVSDSGSFSSSRHARADSTVSPLPTFPTGAPSSRKSQDSLASLNVVDTQPPPIAQMERRPSSQTDEDGRPTLTSPTDSRRSSVYGGARSSRDNSRAPSTRDSLDELSPSLGGDQIVNLPPPPSEIPDNYAVPAAAANALEYHRRTLSAAEPSSLLDAVLSPRSASASRKPSSSSLRGQSVGGGIPTPYSSTTALNQTSSPSSTVAIGGGGPPTPGSSTVALNKPPASSAASRLRSPLSAPETSVAVELIFAVLHSLYTLSSAWTLRRTLLGAAKTFLLRPGNPQLESIRQLVQETALDAQTSDAGLAAHLRQLRYNALPTEAEFATWPTAGMSADESERLRVKARRLLCERGVPQALTSVMGAGATAEALGRVFDALQVERVARGVVFGVALQGVKAVVQ